MGYKEDREENMRVQQAYEEAGSDDRTLAGITHSYPSDGRSNESKIVMDCDIYCGDVEITNVTMEKPRGPEGEIKPSWPWPDRVIVRSPKKQAKFEKDILADAKDEFKRLEKRGFGLKK